MGLDEVGAFEGDFVGTEEVVVMSCVRRRDNTIAGIYSETESANIPNIRSVLIS